MKKALLERQEQFYNDYNIDSRTLPMIVHHYISIGEQAAASLSDEKIEKVYQNAVKEQEAIEAKKNSIYLITPEFQKYILKACQGLHKLPSDLRYAIIKKNI